MNRDMCVSQQLGVSNPLLTAVKMYINLITPKERLTYGDGLKRLFVLSSGVNTFDERDVEAITAKAAYMGMINGSLTGFMNQSIALNCLIYGRLLEDLIYDKISAISNGTLVNPPRRVRGNNEAARRRFYVPPASFLESVLKKINGTMIYDRVSGTASFDDCANDATLLLSRYATSEGHITPQPTSWGLLYRTVRELSMMLYNVRFSQDDYKIVARPALHILWVIAKLLSGDLKPFPSLGEMNITVSGNVGFGIHDGTLAAIPAPTRQTLGLFADSETGGVSTNGKKYLSAVAAATFYKVPQETEGY